MQKKRITREERYEQLINCATKIFAQKGYKSTTTKDISEKAGVSEKMIYVHFKSKQDLFLKCLDAIEQKMRMKYRIIMQHNRDNPLACLEQIGVFLFEYLQKNKHVAGIMSLRAREVNNKTIQDKYKSILQMYADSIEIIARRAIQKGEMPETIDPRAYAWIFIGSYNTFLLMQEFKFKEFSRDFANKVINIIVNELGE